VEGGGAFGSGHSPCCAHPLGSLWASSVCPPVCSARICHHVCRFDAHRYYALAGLRPSSHVVVCIPRPHRSKGEEMHITPAAYRPIAPPQSPSPTTGDRDAQRPQFHAGHTHFWDHAISRRTVIRTAAAGSAVVLGSGLLTPGLAAAKHGSTAPRPIPETIFPGAPFHVLSPGSEEPSTITDFNGFIAATEIQGTGTGGLLFDADMRFMQGTYVGVDGKVHHDTFGFV
jgi:hypothetical protein